MPDILDVLEGLVDQLQDTARWRREKASEYRDSRSFAASSLLETLAAKLVAGDAVELTSIYAASLSQFSMENSDHWKIIDDTNEYIKRIGFDHFPDDAAELLRDLIDIAKRHIAEVVA